MPDRLRTFINDPLVAAPGDEHHYSSYSFNVLGAVERVTRDDFANAVSASLLMPLGHTLGYGAGGMTWPPSRLLGGT